MQVTGCPLLAVSAKIRSWIVPPDSVRSSFLSGRRDRSLNHANEIIAKCSVTVVDLLRYYSLPVADFELGPGGRGVDNPTMLPCQLFGSPRMT